jgi:hypothetical protein
VLVRALALIMSLPHPGRRVAVRLGFTWQSKGNSSSISEVIESVTRLSRKDDAANLAISANLTHFINVRSSSVKND